MIFCAGSNLEGIVLTAELKTLIVEKEKKTSSYVPFLGAFNCVFEKTFTKCCGKAEAKPYERLSNRHTLRRRILKKLKYKTAPIVKWRCIISNPIVRVGNATLSSLLFFKIAKRRTTAICRQHSRRWSLRIFMSITFQSSFLRNNTVCNLSEKNTISNLSASHKQFKTKRLIKFMFDSCSFFIIKKFVYFCLVIVGPFFQLLKPFFSIYS